MLRKLRESLTRSNDDLHAESLRSRFGGADGTPIAEAEPRGPVRVRGEVAGLQVVPRAGAPSLEVTLDDGSGRAVAVFSGRRSIGGLDPGRALVVEGVARREGGRLILLNPAYTLLP